MRSVDILCSFQELAHSPFYFKSFASLPLVDFQSTDMVVLKYLSCCIVAVRGRNLPASSLCRAGSIAYLSLLFYMDTNYLYLLIFCFVISQMFFFFWDYFLSLWNTPISKSPLVKVLAFIYLKAALFQPYSWRIALLDIRFLNEIYFLLGFGGYYFTVYGFYCYY